MLEIGARSKQFGRKYNKGQILPSGVVVGSETRKPPLLCLEEHYGLKRSTTRRDVLACGKWRKSAYLRRQVDSHAHLLQNSISSLSFGGDLVDANTGSWNSPLVHEIFLAHEVEIICDENQHASSKHH